jgi:hypothetical protein
MVELPKFEYRLLFLKKNQYSWQNGVIADEGLLDTYN